MRLDASIIFASFWTLFVTTPGPNALNYISVSMAYGFGRAVICVAAILTQTSLFLTLSAFGITALIATSPLAFLVLQWFGAGFLIYLGIRGWRVANYLAAFSQFIQPHLRMASQMWVIVPTALSLTTLSYVGYCALGSGLGCTALSAIFNTYFRRILAVCFIIYGLFLGSSHFPKGA